MGRLFYFYAMKQLLLILLISLLVMQCNCPECAMEMPYVSIAVDSTGYPPAKNTEMRIYTYYKGPDPWDAINLMDSMRTVSLNWYPQSGNPGRYRCEIDHTITPGIKPSDLNNYNFRLKSLNGSLEIKLSNMEVATDAGSGRCKCEQSKFSRCTINDSITDYRNVLFIP